VIFASIFSNAELRLLANLAKLMLAPNEADDAINACCDEGFIVNGSSVVGSSLFHSLMTELKEK